MIHWLVQSLSDHPDLERGEPPPGLLSAAESAHLEALRVAKRRRDWILGRWTAKHLLQSALEREAKLYLPFSAFTVGNDANGAPAVIFDSSLLHIKSSEETPGEGADGTAPSRVRLDRADALSLSISHSGNQAFCAVSMIPNTRIGADIELIEPRAPEFLSDYFTDEEIAHLNAAPRELRDMLITVTWSGKESALKALRLGLTVDTCGVTCLVDAPPEALDPVLFGYMWSRFTVHIQPELYAAAGFSAGHDRPATVAGWWQILSNYALTLVLLSPGAGRSAR